MNGDGKITKNGAYGSFYFIPKDGKEVTDYTVFEIPTEAVGAADAITKFNVEYYDGTSTKATISNDYISVADGKISTSSCYLGTAAPTTKTVGFVGALTFGGKAQNSTGVRFNLTTDDVNAKSTTAFYEVPFGATFEADADITVGFNLTDVPEKVNVTGSAELY